LWGKCGIGVTRTEGVVDGCTELPVSVPSAMSDDAPVADRIVITGEHPGRERREHVVSGTFYDVACPHLPAVTKISDVRVWGGCVGEDVADERIELVHYAVAGMVPFVPGVLVGGKATAQIAVEAVDCQAQPVRVRDDPNQ
jgi:hypothetical protein